MRGESAQAQQVPEANLNTTGIFCETSPAGSSRAMHTMVRSNLVRRSALGIGWIQLMNPAGGGNLRCMRV